MHGAFQGVHGSQEPGCNNCGVNDTYIDRYTNTYHYSVHGERCHDQCGARSGSPQLYNYSVAKIKCQSEWFHLCMQLKYFRSRLHIDFLRVHGGQVTLTHNSDKPLKLVNYYLVNLLTGIPPAPYLFILF